MMPNMSDSEGSKRIGSPERGKKKATQRTMLNYLTSPKNEGQKPVVTPDWRLECKDFVSMRLKARKEGLFTDIQFVMGEEVQRKEFYAHKSILACASPVFECMFYGPEAPKETIIETDDDPEAFDMLLNYIYGKDYETRFESLITARKFFMICDKYLIYKIEKKAKECIKEIYFNDNDFWNVIQENNFSCPLLRDKFNSYIMENTHEFFSSSDRWLSAPETVVENILQMDKLNIEEHILLMEVTEWAYENKKPVTTQTLMKYYKNIRFSVLPSYEFMKFIGKYPKALEAETYLEILRHIHAKSRHNLPEWCSTSKVSRKREYQNFLYGDSDDHDDDD